ncbi:MAG: LytTR family transcriptional regulator [Bacteroidales bacterium]|nr:LytTR family transcriptional regulator [Bacteroidales bacterium]
MARVFDFLKKSYPFNDDLKQNIKLIFLISLVLFLLLFLFQPFNITALTRQEKYLLIGGLIVVNFLALSLNLLLIPSFLSQRGLFRNWNILKEILWNIWMIFTITTGYFIYFGLIGSFSFNFFILVKILIISSIPIAILVPYNRYRLLKSHLHSALELNKHLEKKANPLPEIVHLKSDYEKDDLSVDVNTLLYIHSASNYVEVYWEEKESIQHKMIRCTLRYAEEAFRDYPLIFRCHRTYIVNINKILKVEGSSQGYTLYVSSAGHKVTVSRNYIPEFKALFYKS